MHIHSHGAYSCKQDIQVLFQGQHTEQKRINWFNHVLLLIRRYKCVLECFCIDACSSWTSYVWELIDVNVTDIRYLMDQRERKTLLAQVKDSSLSFHLVLIHHSLHSSFPITISGTPDQSTVSICLLEHHTQPIPYHWHKHQWLQNSDGPTWNNSTFQRSAKIAEGSYNKYFFETELLRRQNSPTVVFMFFHTHTAS